MPETDLFLIITTYNSIDEVDSLDHWLRRIEDQFQRIIIVDDCSNDGTFEILKKNYGEFCNYHLHTFTKNTGRPSQPRNYGISILPEVGRVIFMDVDDRLTEDYIEFLANLEDENCYSGVKLSRDYYKIEHYLFNFQYKRKLKQKNLKFKNEVVFSGSSLPCHIAKKFRFIDKPLEDWDYWQQVLEGSNCSFFRLLDTPIFYNTNVTLSPKKFIQVNRIRKRIGMLGLLPYALLTIRLKLEERLLKFRLRV